MRKLLAMVCAGVLLAGCGTSTDEPASKSEPDPTPSESTHAGHEGHDAEAAPVRHLPLREGERRIELKMPESYTPSAPTGVGTDDYRCFLLDPKLDSDQMITGFNVLPGNPDVVHHVIMFRVSPEDVDDAEQIDESTPGQGWTCFGDAGIGRGPGEQIDDAPWLGAWAPGGKEQVFKKGFGESFPDGSRVVMQVHYNLLAGKEPDTSAAELRLTAASPKITPLVTKLMPAPVELPCRPEHADGELCDRAAALADVKKRFGTGPGATADLLHFLCGEIKAGPVQSCTRYINKPETIRGVAGHMHLLGRSIKMEVNPGTPEARTILDIPIWNFDDQGSIPIKPAKLEPGDTVKVTCRHTQKLRDQLPSFKGTEEKYVLWGEGTTDEMCLGILQVTRP